MSAFPPQFRPMCGTSLRSRRFDGRLRAYCEPCDEHIFHLPFPSAGTAVVDGSRVCLIERATDPYRGTWTIPGGIIEQGERPDEAAVRELREETNVETAPADCLLCTTWVEAPVEELSSIGIVYAVPREATTGQVEAGEDVRAARFWDVDEIRRSDEQLRPGEAERIQRAIRVVEAAGD